MKLAFFSPMNPQKSGISDYSEELLPYLAQNADIDLFLAKNVTPSHPEIITHFSWFPHTEFAKRHQQRPYDLCLYQMGNNTACHDYMDEYIQRYPGILTLHDYVLHHFYAEKFYREKRFDDYQRALIQYYGKLGGRIADRFKRGIRHDYVYYQLPFYQYAVEPSLGVIVHSHYVKEKLLSYNSEYHVSYIPMGIVLPKRPFADSKSLRRTHQLPEDAFIIASFGFIIEGKRIRELLEAFARFQKDVPNALCVLVGEEAHNFDLRELIRQFGLEQKVLITGYVDYEQYFSYITLSDVCVNLRYPSVRATSANILKIMAYAKPIVVSDLVELLEIPPSVCVKIALDETEIPSLTAAFHRLYHDRGARLDLGEAARNFVETYHSIAQTAEKYLAYCRELLT